MNRTDKKDTTINIKKVLLPVNKPKMENNTDGMKYNNSLFLTKFTPRKKARRKPNEK